VVERLKEASIPHALIGAGAMAAHGVSRSTFDVDLLVTDPTVLSEAFWVSCVAEGTEIDVRRGDVDDPLAGVVRFRATGERTLDLVVGRFAWQRDLLVRAIQVAAEDLLVPVVRIPDLILLKLYAGGPQDAWDITQLLALEGATETVAEVERSLARLPSESRALWTRIVSQRQS
jgi:predicted nucleotidyltransferase